MALGFGGDADNMFLQGYILGHLEVNYFKIFTSKRNDFEQEEVNAEIPGHLSL